MAPTPAHDSAADAADLAAFSRTGDAAPFERLVTRHIHLVYAAAARQLRDAHLAEDVAQAVFIILARRAARIRHAPLAPWLLKTTRYVVENAKRAERRRHFHEGRAMNVQPVDSTPVNWDQLAAVLDACLWRLSRKDRNLLTARFLQGRSARDLAAELGVAEAALRKRTERALDHLRRQLAARGIHSRADALEAELAQRAAVAPTPAGLSSLAAAGALASAPPNPAAAAMARSTLSSMKMGALVKAAAVLVTAAAAAMTVAIATTQSGPPATPLPATLASTLPATAATVPDPAAENWTHIKTLRDINENPGEPQSWPFHVNLTTGSYFNRFSDDAHRNDIIFEDVPGRIRLRYVAAENTIYICDMSPDSQSFGFEQAGPVKLQTLLQAIQANTAKSLPATYRPIRENNLDRYDLSEAIPESATRLADENNGGSSFPSIVWVDPATSLIRKKSILETFPGRGERIDTAVAFGGAPITTIYDTGVPKNARVVSLRPAPAAAALADRILARISQGVPDGVYAMYAEHFPAATPAIPNSASFRIFARSGPNWLSADYDRVHIHGLHQDPTLPELPANWDTTAQDDLFRWMSSNPPRVSWSGDGVITHLRCPWQELDLHSRDTSIADITQRGYAADFHAKMFNFANWLYPKDIREGRTSLQNTLERITDPARPNEEGLSFALHWQIDAKDLPLVRAVYWVDPIHDDRPTTYEQTFFTKDGKTITSRETTEFLTYANFPAPDNRSYPIEWETTAKDPADKPLSRTLTRVIPFPRKKFSDLPLSTPIATQPAR